ncbi:berberine/berberine-like, FAD-binding, type 2 [Artemisia annua]|uniref:Berberine/berberine-like, FAD-binding, type 2 n=1 Tax=Artemisia annua TaxID=35608 RepID=A0A2U1L536_ARTAN|nr:berberine/berberine-like, FAD-binding, type 2 [Artemisia annua]
MSSLIFFSLTLFICCFSCFELSNGASDIYSSFLQCLPAQSTQPDPTLSSIVYSSTSNSSSYTSVLQEYIKNRRFNTTSTPKPVLIITPTKESHIQATVLCAKKLNVQIKIRSGGHDYEGISYISSEKTFIVLDMFNFRTINVNIASETAVVQVGAQLGELYYRIWEKSKVHGFPAGVCQTVGVGGHFSGGGYGTMLRKYGLTVDHVIDARIVDVKGRVLDRKSMGEDLFWAIRGGGGASYGVIISYTIKLVAVPKVNTVFRVMKTAEENAADLVYKWQSVAPKIDNDLFHIIWATLIVWWSLMKKDFPELGLKKEDCIEVSWIESVLYWANFDLNTTKPEILLDRHSDNVNFLKRKSDYVQTAIPKSGLNAIFKKLIDVGKVGLVFNPYGGRMNEVASDATPFPHRAGNLYKIQYSVNWNDEDPKLEKDYLNQSRVLYKFMTNYVSKNPRGAFLNYRDLDIGVMTGTGKNAYNSAEVYGEKYFMGNFARLVKVKTNVDPDNFFRNEQSIPVLAGKSTSKSRKLSKLV